MNKKFLSAILFGALMVTSTGTFVSCKDYDDDIENLQEQINKLATKEDMTSQIASLQSALTAAQGEAAAAKATAAEALDKANSIAATATDAEKAAAEAEKAAAKAALDAAAAKEEAIKAAQEEVAKAQKALQEAIAADFEAVKKDLATQIAKLTEKVEAMTGYTTEMVTDINIEYVYPANGGEDQNGKVFGAFDEMLDLNYAKVVDYVYFPKGLKVDGEQDKATSFEFGKGMPGAFTVKAGDVNTVQDCFLINVAPVNAAIPAESLSLINSKGDNLNEYVDITISNYEGLLTGYGNGSRAVASTGLRQVGVQLKNTVDFESFDKKVIADEGREHNTGDNDEYNCWKSHEYVLHALAATDSKGRAVNSEFNIKLHVQKENEVEDLLNSYLESSAFIGKSKIENHCEAEDGVKENGAFPIVLNETFKLTVVGNGGRVLASYVELDPENYLLSETDKKALKLITVSGDKNVVKNGVHKLTVSGDAEGMPVPFKLVTIDYTGNIMVTPFWVMAETPAAMSATFTVTPKSHVDDPTNWDAELGSSMEEFKVPATAATFTINLKACETEHQGYDECNEFIESGDIDNITNYFNFYASDKKTSVAWNKAAYAEFKGTLNLNVMREDKAYEGVIKFYAENGSFLATNDIAVKKVLPTTIPAGLTAKTNAIQSDGTLKVYPKAVENEGIYDLANAFNFDIDGKTSIKGDENLVFNTPAFKTWASYTTDRIITIGKDYVYDMIDGTTKYPTTVTYNYGDIKYHAEGHGVEAPEAYKVTWATKFDIVFACYPVESTYAWYTAPTVYYNEEITIFGKDDKGNDKYNFLTVKNPYGMKTDAFDSENTAYWTDFAYYLNSEKCQKIELWTNGDKTKVNEFFIPTYVADSSKPATGLNLKPNPNSVNTVLSGDVETTVVIYVVDKFGHEHAIEALKFTMKKEHPAE